MQDLAALAVAREVPVSGTQPVPCSSTLSVPWRPLGAEPALKARNMLGKGHDVAGSVSTDTISFLLCLHLLDD